MIIGIGCDIVEIARVAQALDKPVITKLLSEQEQDIASRFPAARKAEWIAGRLAAKEAIYKAMHTQQKISFWKIEVLSKQDGSPVCTSFSDYDVMISIAHEKEYAVAYAMVQTKG